MFFLFCLVRLEFLLRAFKHFIATIFTTQRTIHQFHLFRRMQTNLVETLFLVTQDPGFVTHEDMLQTFPDHAVQTQQIPAGNTLAVRRIRHQNTRLRRLCILLERLSLQFNIFHQTCTADIFAGNIDGLLRDIRAITLKRKFAFLAVIIINLIEQIGIIIDPFLESKFLPVNTRRNVQGNHGCLDQQCTRTTHRIDEIRFAFPACLQDHAGSQHFIQRSLRLIHPITALVQAFTRAVDRQGTVVM